MFENMTPLAIAAGAVTWAIVFLAYPSQVYQMWKDESAAGVSLIMFVVGFFASVVWIFYSLEIKNNLLVVCNALGAVLAVIIIIQIFYYRRKAVQKVRLT